MSLSELRGFKPLKIKEKTPLRGSSGFPPNPPSGSGFGAGAPRRRLTDGRRGVTLEASSFELCLDIRPLNGAPVINPKIKWPEAAAYDGVFAGVGRSHCGPETGGKVY
jgi:hypothetical protein